MNKQQFVSAAQMNFQQFATVEMVVSWVVDSPNPRALLAHLLNGWRERQLEIAQATATANFERTGLIDTTMDDFRQVIAEAEASIRERFVKAIEESEAGMVRSQSTLDRLIGKTDDRPN